MSELWRHELPESKYLEGHSLSAEVALKKYELLGPSPQLSVADIPPKSRNLGRSFSGIIEIEKPYAG
jgi:hypothetical protein